MLEVAPARSAACWLQNGDGAPAPPAARARRLSLLSRRRISSHLFDLSGEDAHEGFPSPQAVTLRSRLWEFSPRSRPPWARRAGNPR